VEVKAVGTDRLFPLTNDEPKGSAALSFGLPAQAVEIAGLLEVCEECADLFGKFGAAAEVDRVLPASDAVGDAVVGSETYGASGAVGFDDGAALGEDAGVVLDEAEGGHGSGGGLGEREVECRPIGRIGAGGFDMAEANEEGGHIGLGAEDSKEIAHEPAAGNLIAGGAVEWEGGDFGLFEEFAPEEEDDAVSGGSFEVIGGLEDELSVDGLKDVEDCLLVLVWEAFEVGIVLEPRGEGGGGVLGRLLDGAGHGESPGGYRGVRVMY
jgi:hypothetical protein